MKHNQEVKAALDMQIPVVALESTVIAHGLPYPENLETGVKVEQIIRDNGSVPATVAMFDGEFYIGMSKTQLARLATDKEIRKISTRDLPIAVSNRQNCATTVAATMFVAHKAGIKVFATGGIGGVHQGFSADISADLPALASTPMITVCSGAKIVLDLPATREWLETHGITILGYRCGEMPAFYSRNSGLPVDQRVESTEEIVKIARARDDLGLRSAILVTVPVPEEFEIESLWLEEMLRKALTRADELGIKGKKITPFLLSEMSGLSDGKTLKANIALLENNAMVAAKIAASLKS